MSKVEELRLDIEELRRLANTAERQKVKDMLSLGVRKWETELIALESSLNTGSESSDASTPQVTTVQSRQGGCYDVKLTNYAWDQSEKFVKIYVTLKNVHTIPAENVRCVYTSKSMDLLVSALDGKNQSLIITNLMHPIVPNESYTKVKTDMVIVFMKKEKSQNWTHVTMQEKKAKDPKVPKVEEGDDPTKSLMDMMKQMYEEGDDEMKRTIAKAWTESREKSAMGGGYGGL